MPIIEQPNRPTSPLYTDGSSPKTQEPQNTKLLTLFFRTLQHNVPKGAQSHPIPVSLGRLPQSLQQLPEGSFPFKSWNVIIKRVTDAHMFWVTFNSAKKQGSASTRILKTPEQPPSKKPPSNASFSKDFSIDQRGRSQHQRGPSTNQKMRHGTA